MRVSPPLHCRSFAVALIQPRGTSKHNKSSDEMLGQGVDNGDRPVVSISDRCFHVWRKMSFRALSRMGKGSTRMYCNG